MIFPKGRARHQNLMTAYTDLSALLSTLKAEGFSGTIEIEFPEQKGILFIDSGEIINGEVKTEGESEEDDGPGGDSIPSFHFESEGRGPQHLSVVPGTSRYSGKQSPARDRL